MVIILFSTLYRYFSWSLSTVYYKCIQSQQYVVLLCESRCHTVLSISMRSIQTIPNTSYFRLSLHCIALYRHLWSFDLFICLLHDFRYDKILKNIPLPCHSTLYVWTVWYLAFGLVNLWTGWRPPVPTDFLLVTIEPCNTFRFLDRWWNNHSHFPNYT